MAIIGKDTNLPIMFISKALACSRGVGRILIGKKDQFYVATGFIIANNLVVTLNRIIPDPAVATDAVFQLDYYVREDGSFNNFTNVKFDPIRFFYTNLDLDISVVALEDHPDLKGRAFTNFHTNDLKDGEYVNLIHHPLGEPLKISIRGGTLMSATENLIEHTAPTSGGSSGAPVFNDRWEIIGIHSRAALRQHNQISEWINQAINIVSFKKWFDTLDVAQSPSPVAISSAKTAHVPDPIQKNEEKEERNSVFISYAHEDQEKNNWNDKLVTSLESVPAIGQPRVWQDDRIKAGDLWEVEIKEALKKVKVAVLLIGPSFLASDFIRNNELPAILQAAEKEGVRIIPVITHYCVFKHTTLYKFKSFNDPEKPLQGMPKSKADKLLQELVDEIVKEY